MSMPPSHSAATPGARSCFEGPRLLLIRLTVWLANSCKQCVWITIYVDQVNTSQNLWKLGEKPTTLVGSSLEATIPWLFSTSMEIDEIWEEYLVVLPHRSSVSISSFSYVGTAVCSPIVGLKASIKELLE